MDVDIPPRFIDAVIRRDGDRGRRWVDALPGIVERVLTDWTCVAEAAVRFGQVGLVIPVSCADGRAMLKLAPPSAAMVAESAALLHLDGHTTVRLYRFEPAVGAMLLERADGPAPGDVLNVDETVDLLGDLSRQMAVPGFDGAVALARTVPDWSEQLDGQIRRQPGVISASDEARARAAIRLIGSDRTITMLHGDLHEGNVRGARRARWLVFDPKGWVGTAAFDAWTAALTSWHGLLHERDPGAVLMRRVLRFARAADVDEVLAVEIAHARLVSSVLFENETAPHSPMAHLLRRALSD